jgi:hypothetical protein
MSSNGTNRCLARSSEAGRVAIARAGSASCFGSSRKPRNPWPGKAEGSGEASPDSRFWMPASTAGVSSTTQVWKILKGSGIRFGSRSAARTVTTLSAQNWSEVHNSSRSSILFVQTVKQTRDGTDRVVSTGTAFVVSGFLRRFQNRPDLRLQGHDRGILLDRFTSAERPCHPRKQRGVWLLSCCFAVSQNIGPNRACQTLVGLRIAFHERRQKLLISVEGSQYVRHHADARREIGEEGVGSGLGEAPSDVDGLLGCGQRLLAAARPRRHREAAATVARCRGCPGPRKSASPALLALNL